MAFKISESEWQVMEILWEKAPQSSLEVVSQLTEIHDWKPQTIKTLLGRLVKKKVLTYTVIGNRYLYSPAVSRNEIMESEADSFLERFCEHSLKPFLVHSLNTRRKLEPDEIEALRDLLDQNTESNSNE